MSEIGSGNNSSYPAAIDTDSVQEGNDLDFTDANVWNDLADAIIKIETELGVNPAMGKTDMLTYLQTEHTNSGSHSEDKVITLSGVQGFFDDKTFNSNIIMGSGYTVDGIDLSTEIITESGVQTMTGQKTFDADLLARVGNSSDYVSPQQIINNEDQARRFSVADPGPQGYQVMRSYTLPANALNNLHKGLYINAFGEMTATGGEHYFQVYFGNTKVSELREVGIGSPQSHEILVFRSGYNTQRAIAKVNRLIGLSYVPPIINSSPTEDLTSDINIEVRASGLGTLSEVISDGLIVKLWT
ncbi:MAG: hypothetical protein ACE5GU_13725 [Candidatus Scalinduaceae bacterium]